MEFDDVLAARRSTRSFTAAMPTRDQIESIIWAGLLAPYASSAPNGKGYFRRFRVIMRDCPAMAVADKLIMKRATMMLTRLNVPVEASAVQREQLLAQRQRLEMMSQHGVLIPCGMACYIVVAEARGFPPAQHESLAHCLENMWLKATALGLGFRLLTITSAMEEDADFGKLLDLPPGEFALNGCGIGFSEHPLPPASRPPVAEVTCWL